jgi:hypothetical protein
MQDVPGEKSLINVEKDYTLATTSDFSSEHVFAQK